MSSVDPSAVSAAVNEMTGVMRKLSPEERSRAIEMVYIAHRNDVGARVEDIAAPQLRSFSEDRMLAPSAPIPYSSLEEPPSPKEFLLDKNPQTDVERIACLAYYLQHYRDVQQFKTADLNKLNTEAAQPKFTNASFAAKNAVDGHYLAAASKANHRQLTGMGERFVEALPDHDAAVAVKKKSKHPRRRKQSKVRNRGKSAAESA